jgi:hypothetical protein
MKSFSTCSILGFAMLGISIISCTKDSIQNTPIPVNDSTIAGFKDSTLLIKSISYALYDSADGTVYDSGTQYYLYDTIQQQIILSAQPVSNAAEQFDGVIYSYNDSGLLSQALNKYTSYTPGDNSAATATYTYDGNKIINTAKIFLVNGMNYTILFSKISLPSGGYQLSWVDTSPYNGNPAITSYVTNFDSKGKLISYDYLDDSKIKYSDSMTYDAGGNISKVIETSFFYQTPPYTTSDSSETFTRYDFISRDARGNQLYNLNQVVYNGIANFPNSASDAFLGNGDVDENAWQLTKFPALSTRIRRQNQSNGNVYFADFNSTPQYDSKNRLVKYRLFFNDVQLDHVDYIITYYK